MEWHLSSSGHLYQVRRTSNQVKLSTDLSDQEHSGIGMLVCLFFGGRLNACARAARIETSKLSVAALMSSLMILAFITHSLSTMVDSLHGRLPKCLTKKAHIPRALQIVVPSWP